MPPNWIGVDLGATNLRLYQVHPGTGAFSLICAQRLPDTTEGRIQLTCDQLGPGPEAVALATAGLKDPERMGVVESHFAPTLPQLVPRIRRATGRRVAPLQDDGWAAAAAELRFGSLGPNGYYLGSGTGLAEAVSQGGRLVSDLVQAYREGREEALRASNWRHRSDEDLVGLLRDLVDWRSETYTLEQVVLAQRFSHRPQLAPKLAAATGLEVRVSEFIAAPAVGAVVLSLEGASSCSEKPLS